MDPTGLAWGCPREPVPAAAACGVRALSSLRPHCCRVPSHQEVTPSKPLRCCWPWRSRGGFYVKFPARESGNHPGAPRTGPSLLALPSLASPVPAGQPQPRRVGSLGRGCEDVMPRAKHSARAGRAWPFLRARCQPSTPNPAGENPPGSGYLSPFRLRLPRGTRRPRHPLPAADGCTLVSPMAAPQRCLRGSELTREDGLK